MPTATACNPESQYPQSLYDLDRYFHNEVAALMAMQQAHAEAQQRANDVDLPTTLPSLEREHFETLWERLNEKSLALAHGQLSEQGLPVDLRLAVEWLNKTHLHALRDVFRLAEDRHTALRAGINGHYERVNPFRIWDHVMAQYTPDRIRQQAMKKAALRFISSFSLRRNPKVHSKGRHVVLCITVWSDKKWSSSQRELHFNGRQEFTQLAQAFEILKQTAEVPLSMYDIEGLAAEFRSISEHGFAYDSRQKYEFPGDIQLILYKSEFKLYLPYPLASAMNLLITEHGDLNR